MQHTQLQTTGIVRRAGLQDAPQLAELFRPVYPNSSHPFQRLSDIEDFLSDLRNFEVVVEREQKIVAGAAMTYCAWNDSYELGRAITHPDHQGHGLAALLVQEAVRQVCARDLGSVFFGFPRVRRIADICFSLQPQFVPVGHDGGRNVANGKREVHLIIYAIPRHAGFVHVAPDSAVGNSSFRERLYRTMGLTTVSGAYPDAPFIGALHSKCRRHAGFVYDGGPSSANNAIEITGYDESATDPAALCQALQSFIAEFRDARHFTVTLLADKVELIQRLLDLGFVVAAYLPAWYAEREHRFDCVQLTRASYTEAATVQGFDNTLTAVSAELDRIYSRA